MSDNGKKREEVIQHLQMIQGVIARMNSNSFLLKRWSIALTIALLVYIHANIGQINYIAIAVLNMPIIAFWLLDSVYLRQEKGYVALHDKVCKRDKTDFEMRGLKKKFNFWSVAFSKTICSFYLIEILLLNSLFALK